MSAAFDARPLTMKVDGSAVRAHRAQLAQRFPNASVGNPLIGQILLVGIAVVFAIVAFAQLSVAFSMGTPLATVPTLVFLAIPAIIISGAFSRGGRRRASLAYRLDMFAQANGMEYHPGHRDPRLPGMIFSLGKSRRSQHLVRGREPRFVEFGNYRYTTGSGKNKTTHRWGYVAVRLDAPLPHIVLDAKGNNGLFGSNLPIGFRKNQRLSLEGSFDDHFSLYCPDGYETDALYLFTPDVMQRFIDSSAQLDVEIVDDWLFFYTKMAVATDDPRHWEWLFGVVGTMLDKLAQWGRWRDDRIARQTAAQHVPRAATAAPVAPDHVEAPALQGSPMVTPPKGVAQSGQRLRRGRVGWTIGIGILLVVLFQVFGGLLQRFVF